jgi:hypothetical protein
MAKLVLVGFVARILLFFVVMVCGAVLIGTVEFNNNDLKTKTKNQCSCSLSIRMAVFEFKPDCGNDGEGPCQFVVFTSASMICLGFLFFSVSLFNLVKGFVQQ